MRTNERPLEHINLSDIDLGYRHREDLGDITDLATDIKEQGVICAIAVLDKSAVDPDELQALNETDPDKPFLLMAGERRVRASIEAGMSTIPAQVYQHKLSELEFLIIELHENDKRKDFSFVEDIKLKKKIHELMVAEHGEKASTSPDASGVSMTDVAAMVNVSQPTMSRDIRLAEAIEQHPELAQAESKKAAMKALDALVKERAKKKLLERKKARESTKSEKTQRDNLIDSYRVGNFFDAADVIPDGTFNLIEIDPPYAIDLKKTKKEGDTDEYNEISPHNYEAFMRHTLNIAYNKMSQHSWLICWFAPDPWFDPLFQWMLEAGMSSKHERGSAEWWEDFTSWIKDGKGLQLRRIPAVWFKRTGQTNQPSRYLASAVEYFYYARKGAPSLGRPGSSNCFDYTTVSPKKKIHPTERPIEMMEDILKTFINPGGTVLVPFAGSGNTLLAAAKNNMTAIGWDLSQSYKDSFDLRVATEPFGQWRSY